MFRELLMDSAPLRVAVCPYDAPGFSPLHPCRLTFSLHVPLTKIVDPGMAYCSAALMLGYSFGLAPEQSTRICAHRPSGKNRNVKTMTSAPPPLLLLRKLTVRIDPPF